MSTFEAHGICPCGYSGDGYYEDNGDPHTIAFYCPKCHKYHDEDRDIIESGNDI